MFNSKYSKFLTILLVVAIIAIVVLLGFFGYDLYIKYFKDKDAQHAIAQFEQEIEDNNQNTVDIGGEIEGVGETNIGGDQTNKGKTQLSGYYVIGTIEIPKINIKYPVLENVTKGSIEVSVAMLSGPGLNQVGNTVIVGHNYRNGTMFSKLSKLSNGDTIYVTDYSGNRLKYTIYNIYETTAEDYDYSTRDTQGGIEISLSTCVTNNSKKRTIVWAKAE